MFIFVCLNAFHLTKLWPVAIVFHIFSPPLSSHSLNFLLLNSLPAEHFSITLFWFQILWLLWTNRKRNAYCCCCCCSSAELNFFAFILVAPFDARLFCALFCTLRYCSVFIKFHLAAFAVVYFHLFCILFLCLFSGFVFRLLFCFHHNF